MLHADVVDAAARARVRSALDAAGWRAQAIADRFRWATATLDDPLIARLVAFASERQRAPLRLVAQRWLRLVHGDYQLMKGDALDRPRAPHLELVADLSAAATGEAEIFYSDGRALPQLPGAVALVARDAALLRWQRHLSYRVGSAEVHRLILALAEA